MERSDQAQASKASCDLRETTEQELRSSGAPSFFASSLCLSVAPAIILPTVPKAYKETALILQLLSPPSP